MNRSEGVGVTPQRQGVKTITAFSLPSRLDHILWDVTCHVRKTAEHPSGETYKLRNQGLLPVAVQESHPLYGSSGYNQAFRLKLLDKH